MSGGSGAASLAGEGGGSDWRRIYDRFEAMLPRVEALAADRARLEALNRTQHDLSGARENSLHTRLLQAESSRRRWKTAYIELPLLANPKIIELQENDLEDSRNRHLLLDVDNSGSKMQLKEATRHVELSDNNVDYDNIARDLRAELRELKQAAEAAQKLQQNIKVLQVAAGKKDDEISRLRAETFDAEIKLREMEKENTALLKIKEVEGAQATEATHKLQKSVKALQVSARDKNDEIRRLQAEALASKTKLLVAEGKLYQFQKLKDGQLESLKRKRTSLLNARVMEVYVVMHYGAGNIRATESGVDLCEFEHVEIQLIEPEKVRISVAQYYLTVNFGLDPNFWTVRIHALWTKSRTNIFWELFPLDRTNQWVSWLASCKRRGTQPEILVLFVPKQNNLEQCGGGVQHGESSQATGSRA